MSCHTFKQSYEWVNFSGPVHIFHLILPKIKLPSVYMQAVYMYYSSKQLLKLMAHISFLANTCGHQWLHLDLSRCPLLHKSLQPPCITDCKGSDTTWELRMQWLMYPLIRYEHVDINGLNPYPFQTFVEFNELYPYSLGTFVEIYGLHPYPLKTFVKINGPFNYKYKWILVAHVPIHFECLWKWMAHMLINF